MLASDVHRIVMRPILVIAAVVAPTTKV